LPPMRLTPRGYDPRVLVSLLQKSIRRNQPALAGFAASELLRGGYANWAWRRLAVTAAEDTAALVQAELAALRKSCDRERRERRGPPTRVFVMKAVLLLCGAWKSRDADHLSNLVVDRIADDDPRLLAALAEAEAEPEALPGWCHDVHTSQGRARGKTRADFFRDEQEALTPRLPGLFDDLPWAED
jgi:alpha-beta hydrolase superfamily lysophospholipase